MAAFIIIYYDIDKKLLKSKKASRILSFLVTYLLPMFGTLVKLKQIIVSIETYSSIMDLEMLNDIKKWRDTVFRHLLFGIL